MVKTAITLLGIALVAATWWYVFDSRAPREADDAIPLEALRTAIAADDARHLPREVELYRTGRGTAPMFAVEAGGGLGKFEMAYTAFGIRYRDSRMMIDAAADRETAMAIGDKAAARFDDAAYALLLDRIAQADQVILTHEHKDHVMAVVRHPAFGAFADRFRFPEAQRYGLLRHSGSQAIAEAIGSLAAHANRRGHAYCARDRGRSCARSLAGQHHHSRPPRQRQGVSFYRRHCVEF